MRLVEVFSPYLKMYLNVFNFSIFQIHLSWNLLMRMCHPNDRQRIHTKQLHIFTQRMELAGFSCDILWLPNQLYRDG